MLEFREFDVFNVPTRVEGGNHFGTDDYFPFFKAARNVHAVLLRQSGRCLGSFHCEAGDIKS